MNIPRRLGEDLTVPAPHHITSPWAAAQSATQATRSPASSPQQLIQHTPTSRLHPHSDRGFINKADNTPSSPNELASAATIHEYTQCINLSPAQDVQELTNIFWANAPCVRDPSESAVLFCYRVADGAGRGGYPLKNLPGPHLR